MTEISVGSMPISTLVSESVVWVAPDASLVEVARTLADAEVGAAIVRNEASAEPSGIVSERDLVRAIGSGRDPRDTTASEVAHTEIAWADATATVAEVAEEMMDQYVRHVLVEDSGRLTGVVSVRDLLGAYAAVDPALESD
ncbi:MAG TPA: CBS domain-containing protein [Acidimicrobiales bacterium]|nr:CBS domain-containing protein [Acidimicrobiales bacterium]